MIKFVIKKLNGDAMFIFHALPDLPDEIFAKTKCQWYITENKKPIPIKNATMGSYFFSAEQIELDGYTGKYLYCEYTNTTTNETIQTEHVKLYYDVNKMIKAGVVFDAISHFDENGDIIDDISL